VAATEMVDNTGILNESGNSPREFR